MPPTTLPPLLNTRVNKAQKVYLKFVLGKGFVHPHHTLTVCAVIAQTCPCEQHRPACFFTGITNAFFSGTCYHKRKSGVWMKMKTRKKVIITAVSIILFLTAVYFLLINFLVSAALVPSFMEKLESFERITEESFAKQVQSADIKVNHSTAVKETKDWLYDEKKEMKKSKKITAVTKDGYSLVAREFAAAEESSSWALLLHGYTGSKEEMYPFAYWYHEQGYHVIVPDLRAQGESEGDYIGMGWTDHTDCMLWIDYILSQNEAASIVLHGQSMGAATALMMAGDQNLASNVKAVISDCSYTDAYTMFGEKIKEWFSLPAFPFVDSARLVLKMRGGYDLMDASALEAVKNAKIPILFIHGDQDAMISVDMSKDLYEAANCEKELLIIEGAGHAQAQDKDPDTYFVTISSFLEAKM